MFNALYSAILSPWNAPQKSLQDLSSSSAFAQEVCPKLIQVIKALPKDSGLGTVRGLLPIKLADFQTNLSSLGNVLNNVDTDRARRALNHLERLCCWPNPYYPAYTANSNFIPEMYPSLSALLTNEESTRESLKNFVVDFKIKRKQTTAFWTQLVGSLDIAGNHDVESTLMGPNHSELVDRRVTIENCQDKEPFILSLYNSLIKHCQCHCKLACDFMTVNVGLNCYDNPQRRNAKFCKFNLLFQDLHDTQDSESVYYWRNIQISVCATTTTRVKFQEDPDTKKPEEQEDISEESDDDEFSDSNSESSELEEELELCQFITKARNSQLQVKLAVSNAGIRLRGECIPPRRFLTNAPSTSLASLLNRAKLTDRNKSVLSYHLVYSVWQYYDSSWEDWSNKTVQFMSERIGLDISSEVVYVNQPFLHSKFGKKMPEATTSISTADKGGGRKGGLKKSHRAPKVQKVRELKSHHYPKILALGIMLLEIQLGHKLEYFKTSDYYDQDLKIAHHLLALDLLKDKELWPPENAWMAIKEIVEICIDDKRATKTFGNDNLMVRQRLYEQAVAPLRVFILEAWKPKGIEDVDPVTLEKANSVGEDVPQIISSLSAPVPSVQISAPPSPRMVEHHVSEQAPIPKLWLGGTMPAESTKSSEEWFQNLDELTSRLSIVKRDKSCLPTKVAILDTGVTEQCYQILEGYIKGYKDFVSSNDNIRQDGTGHGTTALRLLLKLYDDAEVYVGRVFEHKDADDETERLMAEAITHAKTQWKVDIICLPSGFNPDLRNAPYRDQLYNAVVATPVNISDPRTLIFSAASNLGFASKITYPGCLSRYSKVICLFSTANGDPDRPGFNPAAVPNTYNFALLGDSIQIDPEDQPIRGTSFSTIIAGAIAAHIIDFSNHPDTKDNILDVWYLREVEGMTSVFASMRAVKKNGYHILEPWKLKEHYQSKALNKKELRQEICRNISEALGKRNDRDYL